MKEQLIHILDQSVCLSRKQMKEYLSGTMLPEEAHAAEVHLSSCPLCSLAMEGFEEHTEEALAAISALNSGFLKEHFANISPQIHLNSMAPAATMPMARSGRRHSSVQPLWRVGSIAAGIILIFGLIWAFERSHNKEASPASRMAMNGNGGGNNGAGTEGTVNRSSDASAGSPNVDVTGNNNAPVNTLNASTTTNDQAATSKNTSATSTTTTRADVQQSNTSSTVGQDLAGMQKTNGSIAAASPVIASPISASDAVTAGGTTTKAPPAAHFYKEYNAAEDSDDGKKEIVAAKPVPTETAKAKSLAAPPKVEADDLSDMERGDRSYSKAAYLDALVRYKKSMSSSDAHTRYRSMVMAAECYAALDQKAKAIELLNKVIAEGPGVERRSARRALRRLN